MYIIISDDVHLYCSHIINSLRVPPPNGGGGGGVGTLEKGVGRGGGTWLPIAGDGSIKGKSPMVEGRGGTIIGDWLKNGDAREKSQMDKRLLPLLCAWGGGSNWGKGSPKV